MTDETEDNTPTSLQIVRGDVSLLEVAQLMRDLDLAGVLVTDENGSLCGVVTGRDIVVRAVAEGCDLARTCARDIAVGGPFQVVECHQDDVSATMCN